MRWVLFLIIYFGLLSPVNASGEKIYEPEFATPSSLKECTNQLMTCSKAQTKILQTLTKTENELTKCKAEKIGITDKFGIYGMGVVAVYSSWNPLVLGVEIWLLIFQ